MEIKDLIIDDNERGIFRYHRSSLTSPDLLNLERKSDVLDYIETHVFNSRNCMALFRP